mgnify:CR=1 FL=1|tara:strand:+ start:392 stop:634 length:243 start_codon:yes stop_codon:yes gene_type:complete
MTKSELRELIVQMIKEYTGTGASGGNAGDGNSITAPGIPHDDEEAVERYINKNIYGADGRHYKKYSSKSDYNRTKFTKRY